MRWYDSETGRWLNKHPIRLGGGLNLYAFCGCEPVGHFDWIGLCSDEDDSSWIDQFQVGLDVIGVFDPTLISDGINAITHASRGKWGDAGISAISMLPYVGDSVKVGKYGVKAYKLVDKGTDAAKAGRFTKKGFATAPEARNAAKQLGFVDTHHVDSRGQAIFKKGNRYFSRDVDGHDGSAWKEWKDAGAHERLGSLDRDLNRIRD